MSQLHLIQTSFNFSEFNRQFLRLVSHKDSLLLLNDSLFLLTQKDFSSDHFKQLTANISIFGLEEQFKARRLEQWPISHVKLIDYQHFAKQCLAATKIISW